MRTLRSAVLVAAGVGLLTGLALGALLRGDSDDAPSGETPGLRAATAEELAALGDALEEERAERLSLAAEVAQLRWALERLAPELAPSESAADAPDPDAGPESAPVPAEVEAASAGPRAKFDESVLLDRGLSSDEIARMRDRFEASEMEQLYLRDRAAREGWSRKPQMYMGLRRIRSELRSDLGEENFDLMLYATGRNNRVIISGVLATSPAEAADLQPGDVILRYDGDAIFAASDLRRAIQGGEAGRPVPVDVARDGEPVRVFLPRGPLGVRMEEGRRAPTATR